MPESRTPLPLAHPALAPTAPTTPTAVCSTLVVTEPPRKRQRTTTERTPLASSPPDRAFCGATSTPSPAASSPTLGTPGSASDGAESAYDHIGGGAAGEGDADADEGANEFDGGDACPPSSMKGGWKGKTKEGMSTQGTPQGGEDGEMVWQSEGAFLADDSESFARDRDHMAGGARPVTQALDSERGEDGPSTLARDPEYYIDGADCVIRVEDTLFRVHRFFLGRDSSAFQHMFSTPSGLPPQSMEGYSDTNPICLHGESVERFRALLSVIYDLPPQLQAYNTPAADMDRLLTIAEMTNKYHFASIETWAVDALYNVIRGLHGPPQPEYQLEHCSSEWMKRLLEVALLCGHAPLRTLVADEWVKRIVSRDLRPVHALELADRSDGLRRLRGYAYYVQLLEMGDGLDPGVVEDGKQYSRTRLAAASAQSNPGDLSSGEAAPRPGTRAVLTRGQRQRLLSGHWSLTRLWDALTQRTGSGSGTGGGGGAPRFEKPDGCTYHQHGCLQTWAQVWADVARAAHTLRHPAADVLGRLRAMEEQLLMHPDLSCALSPQCKRAALLAVKGLSRTVQEGLADHFADLTADADSAGAGCSSSTV